MILEIKMKKVKMTARKVQPKEVKLIPTKAEKIWDQIKEVKLEMFGLPNQFVLSYYNPVFIESDKLYLTAKTHASAVLPALEQALQGRYTVEQAIKFLIIEEVKK